jgi:YidC/Oxa1 family membrane protein insertase
MDTKRLIIGMTLAMSVLLGYSLFYNYLDKKHPEWGLSKKVETEQVKSAETGAPAVAGTATTAPAGLTVVPPGPMATTQMTSPLAVQAVAATRPTDVTIGSTAKNDPKYAMAIDLSPLGGSIDSVTLNDFKQSVNKPDPYVFQQPYKEFESQSRVLATKWVSVDGVQTNLDNVPWALQSSDAGSATFAIELRDSSGQPAVRLTKSYALTDRQAEKDKAAGYEVHVSFAIQNLAQKTIQVSTAFNGTNPPANENDRQPDQQTLAGYTNDRYVVIDHQLVTQYSGDSKTRDWTKHKDGYPLAWVGAGSGYFNAILRPEDATGVVPGPYVAKVSATALKPDAKDYHHEVVTTIEMSAMTLPAGGAVTMPVRAFFFPKQRDLLSHEYLQASPLAFNQTIVLTSGFCGICTFQWIIDILVGMLRGFHVVLRDWGLAIIALVCVVRLVLHPITKRAQVNMMKMGKMGPELERLKKKHGDDKEALNRAMMGFYKEQGATPILGCLPMFLQMPIWIALYSALQSTFELRQSPFLQFGGIKLTWIEDLAHPDRLLYFPNHAINFFFFHIDSLNVLPIVLAVVFFLQQKYTPKPPATTPEQEQQQKMMQWMTLLFPVFLYNGPAGLNLYIATSTTIGIIESKIIRKHIKEQDEKEKAGVVIVDAPKDDDRSKKRRDDLPPKGGVRRVDPKKPQGGLGGWFASLQAKAEELRREAEKRK